MDLNGPYREGYELITFKSSKQSVIIVTDYGFCDCFAAGAAGVTYSQRRGRRWSTYRAYIEPIRRRRTLTIHKHARVYKVQST